MDTPVMRERQVYSGRWQASFLPTRAGALKLALADKRYLQFGMPLSGRSESASDLRGVSTPWL
jgi:hypothetical protein